MILLLIVAMLYFLVGCFLAIPYTHFAGGAEIETFVITAWLIPGTTLFFGLFCLSIILDDESELEVWQRWAIGICIAAWLLAPIWLNGLSHVLMFVGLVQTGAWAFKLRYWSILLIPSLFIAVMFTIAMIRTVVMSIKVKLGSGRSSTSMPASA